MADKESYRVAIDILCCHLGMTVNEACLELGIVEDEAFFLQHIADTRQVAIKIPQEAEQ